MRRLAWLGVAFACAGCTPTIVRTGLPAGRTPDGYAERWHHGFFWGTVDATGAYDVGRICPCGWSEVRVETPVVVGLVQYLTLGIYTPAEVTLVCAATAGDPADAPGEEPLPPR